MIDSDDEVFYIVYIYLSINLIKEAEYIMLEKKK